jgi:NAD(P)-dependent dehydrogenase (short-subunit alcohol dehydrogenase family)
VGILDGKVALVTGAGRGIGRGIALALAKEGASVSVVDLAGETARGVADEIAALGGRALAISSDIRKSDQIDASVAATVERFGGLDILVNNAMAAKTHVPFEAIDDESIDLAFETGPKAVLRYLRAAHPYLAAAKGRVINLRSGSEIQGLNGYGSYIAAKAAVGGITRAAAREWGPQGITVNAICPFVLSEAALQHFEERPQDLESALSALSIRRTGDAEHEIGRAAVFLAGPDASFITGCTVSVDGGGSFIG